MQPNGLTPIHLAVFPLPLRLSTDQKRLRGVVWPESPKELAEGGVRGGMRRGAFGFFLRAEKKPGYFAC